MDDVDNNELLAQIFEAVDDSLQEALQPFEDDPRTPAAVVQTLMAIACNVFVQAGGTRDEFLQAAEDEFQMALEEAALQTVDEKTDFDVN